FVASAFSFFEIGSKVLEEVLECLVVGIGGMALQNSLDDDDIGVGEVADRAKISVIIAQGAFLAARQIEINEFSLLAVIGSDLLKFGSSILPEVFLIMLG